MNKATPNKNVADLTHFCKSTFTLTFAVEILGIDVWHDCNEGWLDLGPYLQGMKLQYQLYPGRSFDLDILIWPHVAKIWCGNQYGYVRTWQFLERRWLAFSIRHAFPARVLELLNHMAIVTCTMGLASLSTNAKNDKNFEAYLPPLQFGERRYFGPVSEKEITIEQNMLNLLRNIIDENIPSSYLDGIFDTPFNTTDIRHQEAILSKVQERILSYSQFPEEEDLPAEPEEFGKSKERRESKLTKTKERDKKKVVEVPKEKYAIILSGDTILAGAGRIIPFEAIGERPPEQSEVIVLISTNNLPAEDDYPVIFINVQNLFDLPIAELAKARISQIFTRWKIGDEEHDSPKQIIKTTKSINFNDHHTVPLKFSNASAITASFLDYLFEIQITTCIDNRINKKDNVTLLEEKSRLLEINNHLPELELLGIRQPKLIYSNPVLFGNDKCDRKFGSSLPTFSTACGSGEEEVLIAVTKIDANNLAKESNGIVKGEYSLYPPRVSLTDTCRKNNCSNDINAVRRLQKPNIVIQPAVILDSQMTLDVSIGLIGCRLHNLRQRYLRLFCYSTKLLASNTILQEILQINDNLRATKDVNEILTGFALDTVGAVIFYVEGQQDGPILKVWELTVDFYPETKPLFSRSDHYSDRVYADMLSSATPFYVLMMSVPLNNLLVCPQVYVKTTLPLPAKSALLKIGRLNMSKYKIAPSKNDMPTNDELKSFTLELCIPSRPRISENSS